MEKITLKTDKQREIVDITDQVSKLLKKHSAKSGFCHLFLNHTTAALTTAELDPESELELFDFFELTVPKEKTFRHKYEHTHIMTHMPPHFIASFLGPSLTIPVEKGKLLLGEFQRIVLVELNGPREREIIFDF